MWRQNNKLFFKCRIPQKDYSYKTFFACSQVFPLVAEVFLFVSRTAPSLWIIFCPFVSYNVNWHEDNLSVDQEHRWFVRGEEVCFPWNCLECCLSLGNMLREYIALGLDTIIIIKMHQSEVFYSYRTSHLFIILPMSEWNSDRSSYFFLQSPRFCKGWFFFLTWDN